MRIPIYIYRTNKSGLINLTIHQNPPTSSIFRPIYVLLQDISPSRHSPQGYDSVLVAEPIDTLPSQHRASLLVE